MVHPTFDPYGLVILAIKELARAGVKSRFTGEELSDARDVADEFLVALGVTPLIGDNGE